ncbi:hypothetical protein SUDANB105_04631 [Streptomyces sp. enrichment culture]|uniref:hypothetical protein n=1 Tax=Streptomyces sp. enrichment culture TaxID=1795815 RepID=UPI003F5691A6
MDDDICGFLLLSDRERSALWLDIHQAASKAEVAEVLDRNDVSEDDFVKEFTDLAKVVQLLPD